MTNFYFKALGVSVLSATLGFIVACGDSAIHREGITKLPADAQRRQGHSPQLNDDGKFSNPGNSSDQEIDNHLNSDTAYADFSADKWPKGSYVLSSVDTFAKFMPNASKNWVHVFNSSQVTITNGVATASATPNPITVGMLNNKTDNGIGVQIPVSFDTQLTQPFMDDMNVNKDTLQIFVSKILTKGSGLVVNDRFDTFNGAIPFDTVLAGNYGTPMVKASLQKIDETHFQAKLSVDDTTTVKGTTVSRVIIFVYTYTAPPVSTDKKAKAKTNDVSSADPGAVSDSEEEPTSL